MCGIAGWLGHWADCDGAAERMRRALHHRGPDAHGIQSWPEATLVHTRLSIIDLSPTGAQPMGNEDGTIWTVFNGEIYNHRELRHRLESSGHVFKGRSDTEILPHLYEEDGLELVKHLRGMFAFAIFDKRRSSLLLARDRFGIKPLFYAVTKGQLLFASELNALLQMPGVDDSPDPQAISDFAALFYIPAPQTFYKGIRALEPSEILEATLDGDCVSWRIHRYHRWKVALDPTLTLEAAVERAGELLTATVRSQLESDVPLGALLSGGIDSSLVSTAAQQARTNPLLTFNVRFPEKEYDETWAAVAVANHIGSVHQTLDMGDVHGTWEHITGLLAHAGQPFADSSLFATHAVCRLMRQHVTVALSGDGGDEGFGGYNFYWQAETIARCKRLPSFVWRWASRALAPLAGTPLVSTRLPGQLRELAEADDVSVIQSLLCWVRESEHNQLCRDLGVQPVRRLFERQWEHDLGPLNSRLERLSALATEVNVRLMLPSDFLYKVDIASMKEGLEVRVPLLDEELLGFGLHLPHRLKVRRRQGKRVLRALASEKLPPAVASKPKRGFSIPVDDWSSREFKSQLKETLTRPGGAIEQVFRPGVYEPVIEAFCDGRPYARISRPGLYQRVIMLLSLHLALSNGRRTRTNLKESP